MGRVTLYFRCRYCGRRWMTEDHVEMLEDLLGHYMRVHPGVWTIGQAKQLVSLLTYPIHDPIPPLVIRKKRPSAPAPKRLPRP